MCNRIRSVYAAAVLSAACALPFQSVAKVELLELYSSPDGEYQALLLEDASDDPIDHFHGLTLVMKAHNGDARKLTLSAARLFEPSIEVDGKRRFLLATRAMSSWIRTQAVLPDNFLEVEGGTLTLFGSGSRDYPPLPVGGAVAFEAGTAKTTASNRELARHPGATANEPLPSAWNYFSNPPPPPTVREYYHAGLDHYFLAVSQREKADLDSGRRPGWRRTGKYFRSLDAKNASETAPVCRYYLPSPYGDTHLYSAIADECASIARNIPGALLETSEAFHVALPEPTTGLCIPSVSEDSFRWYVPTIPLYRAWNRRFDTNHRYTVSAKEHAAMVARGWVAEGYGEMGVVMCVDAFDHDVDPTLR